jgi:hypothetical protein
MVPACRNGLLGPGSLKLFEDLFVFFRIRQGLCGSVLRIVEQRGLVFSPAGTPMTVLVFRVLSGFSLGGVAAKVLSAGNSSGVKGLSHCL